MRKGFGLIEFMIVITVFGIATAVITASFLTFERNQRLKSAALMLKNDIRLVQNKALSGDKGVVGADSTKYCASGNTLAGWYLKIDASSDNGSYIIAGDCKDSSGNETAFNVKSVSLPRGVRFPTSPPPYVISCGVFNDAYGTIFYQPLTYNASFHNNSVPPFLSAGSPVNTLPCTGDDLVVTLQTTQGVNTYQVIVQPSGEVNEQK